MKQPLPDLVEARAAHRQNLQQLLTMSNSLATEDELSAAVTRSDEAMVGELQVGPGMLTFIARELARMAKENLEL